MQDSKFEWVRQMSKETNKLKKQTLKQKQDKEQKLK